MRSREPEEMPDASMWNREELAAHLAVPIGWIDSQVSARAIPYVRFGHRTVRFPKTMIESWIMTKMFVPPDMDKEA